jgi:hypothetical protein
MSNYIITNGELYHHGVKGMKWGVRRYQNPDGSLTPAGIKRYATKGYARDSYYDNSTRIGRAFDRVSGRHLAVANEKYRKSSPDDNQERAEQYVRDRRDGIRNAPAKVAGILAAVGGAYAVDQVYFKGKGTKIAKTAINIVGRSTIMAVKAARGGYDFEWYDKSGRRVW